MKFTQQQCFSWDQPLAADHAAQLVFVFASRALLSDQQAFIRLRQAFPAALIAGCSTAGEICDTSVSDDSAVVTALQFSATQVRYETAALDDVSQSRAIGTALATSLLAPDLVHVFVLSDGLLVNGGELVAGIRECLPSGVLVTGGLAGDGSAFEQTMVMANSPALPGQVIAIGLYGTQLQVGCGSLGGWDTFGPDRLITKAQNNILYELDGKPALDLYKTYLGPLADELPSSGLLFPLAVEMPGASERVVRTILAVNETDKSLIFAGDLPCGSYAQLMKANFNRLIDGAIGAAQVSMATFQETPAQFALLISCVGRKLVLKQRIEEEVEGVREELGAAAVMTGFYSYGEIAPHGGISSCELHNQTMTITLLREIE